MDLSKAFDTLPHDLTVKKLEDYDGNSKVINLVTNDSSDRQQRGQHSPMKTIMKGVPQGPILGPILFNIFMNELSYAIDEFTLFNCSSLREISTSLNLP